MTSRLFISVLEGESPDTMRPLFMTGDHEVLQAVAVVLERRLQGDKDVAGVVRLVRDRGQDDE